MGSDSKITLRLLCAVLAVLLLPGWVELAEGARGRLSERDSGVLSAESPCCDQGLTLALRSEGEGAGDGCLATCEHCWCCGSLPALPSLARLMDEPLRVAQRARLHVATPQAPPLRSSPPPVRPPIL